MKKCVDKKKININELFPIMFIQMSDFSFKIIFQMKYNLNTSFHLMIHEHHLI